MQTNRWRAAILSAFALALVLAGCESKRNESSPTPGDQSRSMSEPAEKRDMTPPANPSDVNPPAAQPERPGRAG
jgi:uncharacterized lipoprotein